MESLLSRSMALATRQMLEYRSGVNRLLPLTAAIDFSGESFFTMKSARAGSFSVTTVVAVVANGLGWDVVRAREATVHEDRSSTRPATIAIAHGDDGQGRPQHFADYLN